MLYAIGFVVFRTSVLEGGFIMIAAFAIESSNVGSRPVQVNRNSMTGLYGTIIMKLNGHVIKNLHEVSPGP